MGRSPIVQPIRAAYPLMCSVRYQRARPHHCHSFPRACCCLGASGPSHTSHSTRGNATEQAEPAPAPCKTGITKGNR